MSTNPSLPEHMRPLAPGYTPRQVAIDAEMVALGRPALSVRQALSRTLLAEHRATVEAWEYAHPTEAARWLELRAQAKAEELRLYEERYGSEPYARERMRRAGFIDQVLVERSMRELRDNACFTATRDWMLDGVAWCLVLSGPRGCGKSQAATYAAFQLMQRNFPPWCAICPSVSESPLYGGEAEEYRWRCAQAGVLVLDDLGEGEQLNEKRAAWRAWVDDVLTQRHAGRRKTVITTNRTPTELSTWLGSRLVDRLREGTVVSTNEASMRGAT
jgi:hypothetical protein